MIAGDPCLEELFIREVTPPQVSSDKQKYQK